MYIHVTVRNSVYTWNIFFPQLFQSSLIISQHDTVYTKNIYKGKCLVNFNKSILYTNITAIIG